MSRRDQRELDKLDRELDEIWVDEMWVRARVEHLRRAGIIVEAADEGLIDYLTCPACRALVPIGEGGTWPLCCERCGRCV